MTLVEKMQAGPDVSRSRQLDRPGTPEMRFVIDRAKAADLGVNAADISRALNIAAAGQRVSTFSEGTKQYDVIVQADEPFRAIAEQSCSYFTVASSTGSTGRPRHGW